MNGNTAVDGDNRTVKEIKGFGPVSSERVTEKHGVETVGEFVTELLSGNLSLIDESSDRNGTIRWLLNDNQYSTVRQQLEFAVFAYVNERLSNYKATVDMIDVWNGALQTELDGDIMKGGDSVVAIATDLETMEEMYSNIHELEPCSSFKHDDPYINFKHDTGEVSILSREYVQQFMDVFNVEYSDALVYKNKNHPVGFITDAGTCILVAPRVR